MDKSRLKLWDLRQKQVVITGAARGIGREAALLLAEKGAHVHVLDYHGGRLAEMRQTYQERFPHLSYHEASVTDAPRLKEIFTTLGRIHILVNNAGIQKESRFMEIELEEWRNTIETNLTGTFLCIQTALPYMHEGDTILNVLTHEGRRTNLYPYAASKAAIKNLTQNLAIELGQQKISINALAFGAVFSERNAAWQDDPEQVRKACDRTPLGFMLQPEEIAWQLVQFLEQSSRYATGSVFDVSGGRSLT